MKKCAYSTLRMLHVEILAQAKERIARRKILIGGDVQREIEYFYEAKDDDD